MSAEKINLTSFAHAFARERLGGTKRLSEAHFFAVDATAGNGRDTLFLARLAGSEGRVATFDIQPRALEKTRRLLEENAPELRGNVSLFLRGHETMAEPLGEAWRGNTRAVFFNLGYLPGGDRSLTTLPSTTLRALDAAWSLLAPRGLISLTVYPRHAGGFEESAQVRAWLEKMRSRAELHFRGEHNPREPWWVGIVKSLSTSGVPAGTV